MRPRHRRRLFFKRRKDQRLNSSKKGEKVVAFIPNTQQNIKYLPIMYMHYILLFINDIVETKEENIILFPRMVAEFTIEDKVVRF